MRYLFQGIAFFMLLLAGLTASCPVFFILEGIYRGITNQPKEGATSFLPVVATIITLPLITVFKLLPGWFPTWMLKAAIVILILDLLLVVPMLLDLGWQKLKGKW